MEKLIEKTMKRMAGNKKRRGAGSSAGGSSMMGSSFMTGTGTGLDNVNDSASDVASD